MKNKRIWRIFAALCAALVLMGGFSVTAFAQGTEQPPAEDATNDENVVVETEDSPALTPEGNAALVDDFGGNKQLITITTKAGNYFYILIDRANEDSGRFRGPSPPTLCVRYFRHRNSRTFPHPLAVAAGRTAHGFRNNHAGAQLRDCRK